MDWFLAGNATLIYNGEAPAGADRCAYAAIYADDGTLIGYAMTGIYIRSIRATMVRMVLFHLLAGVAAWAAGSFLSLRLSRKIKDNLLGMSLTLSAASSFSGWTFWTPWKRGCWPSTRTSG